VVLRGGSARAPYNFVAPWSHPGRVEWGPTLNLPFARPRFSKKKQKETKKKRTEKQADWLYVTGMTLSFSSISSIERSRFVPLRGRTVLFFSVV